MLTWYNACMRNISIQLDDELFKEFAIACAEAGLQKKALIINFIKYFLENEEDRQLLSLAKVRLNRLKKGKAKLVSHKDVWK